MKAKFESDKQKSGRQVSLCKYRGLRNLPHWHMDHELIFLERGSGSVRMDNRSCNITAGKAALIPAECIHDIVCDSESEMTVLKFKLPLLEEILTESIPRSPIMIDRELTVKIRTALEQVRYELESKSVYQRTAVTCIIGGMVVDILRTYSSELPRDNTPRSNGRAQELLSLIEKEYATVTFDSAASAMGLSRTYFSEYFKETCGMTFTEYLNLIKVGEAVRMILEGGHTSTEIALSCGFGCIRSFNRVFKKLTGNAPSALPSDYVFISRSHMQEPIGFDPTLPPTQILLDLC